MIAAARDGARLIVLALRDPVSEADDAVDLTFVEPGGGAAVFTYRLGVG